MFQSCRLTAFALEASTTPGEPLTQIISAYDLAASAVANDGEVSPQNAATRAPFDFGHDRQPIKSCPNKVYLAHQVTGSFAAFSAVAMICSASHGAERLSNSN